MWSMTDASPTRLADLGREIDANGRWTGFLTPQEHELFAAALGHNDATWARFLHGKIPCQLRITGADDASPIIIDVDPTALAFRVRYMLWESLIDQLGVPPKSQQATSSNEASSTALPEQHGTETSETKKNTDDDDYDDDYDDDDEAEASGPVEDASVPEVLIAESKQEDSEPDPRGRVTVLRNGARMYHTFDSDLDSMKRFQRLQESDEQIQQDEEGLDSTNAEDTAAGGNSLVAFAKTAQFGSASLSLKHLLSTIEAKRPELQVTDIELRNLISDVRKNRSKWASEERIGQEELYESCEKVVQELRATTEHSTAFLNKVNKRDAPNYYQIIKNPMDLNTVMRKLRALQYNSKKDFVDDLNLIWDNCLTYNSDPRHFLRVHATAMRKKTQALAPHIPDVSIRSREEVEAEAEKLERLAKEKKRRNSETVESGKGQKRKLGVAPAAPLVTDVDSPALSASERASDADAEFTDNIAFSRTSTPALPHKNDEKDKSVDENDQDAPQQVPDDSNFNANDGETVKEEVAELAVDDEIPVDAAKNPSVEDDDKKGGHASKEPESRMEVDSNDESRQATPAVPGERRDSEAVDAEVSDENGVEASIGGGPEEDYDVPDVETAVWTNATRRQRMQLLTNRKAVFMKDQLQMDAPIIARSPVNMVRFDKALRGEDIIGQVAGLSLLSTDPGEEPFLIEYEVNAGVPPEPLGDTSSWVKAPVPRPQDLKPSRYVSRGLLTDLVNKNLNEMQMIRRLSAKILYIRDLQLGQVTQPGVEQSAGGPGSASEYAPINDPEEDISSRLPGAASFDGKAALSSMQRSAAKLAMLAGFDTTNPKAIEVLASIAGDYLTKLGHTIVANLEVPDSSASFSSIVTGSLEEMGVGNLHQLTKYVSDSILKQGRRLATFRSRLNTMLVDILRPEVEKYQDEQFNDSSDQFVLGQFSNELGDDYFGFKELGLDKELGMSNIAVPFHLLQQRMADQAVGITRGPDAELGLGVPEYPPLNLEDLENLPQFLRPAFDKILLKNTKVDPADADSLRTAYEANASLIADAAASAASARAKMTASGKLAPRKKPFSKAFILEKPPPKPSPPPPAAAADTGNGDGGGNADSGERSGDSGHFETGAASTGDMKADGLEPLEDLGNNQLSMEHEDVIGSLASGEDEPNGNGFSLDDDLPTGSLMLQDDGDAGAGGADAEDMDIDFDFMKKD